MLGIEALLPDFLFLVDLHDFDKGAVHISFMPDQLRIHIVTFSAKILLIMSK